MALLSAIGSATVWLPIGPRILKFSAEQGFVRCGNGAFPPGFIKHDPRAMPAGYSNRRIILNLSCLPVDFWRRGPAWQGLRRRGGTIGRLTRGFTRTGETKAQRIKTKGDNSRQIDLTSLRNHVLRFLKVLEGRLGVGAPLAIDADVLFSPFLQCLLYRTHLA